MAKTKKRRTKAPEPVRRTVEIHAPVAPLEPKAYVSRHIDVKLGAKAAAGIHMLRNGLNRGHAVLAGGPHRKHVESAADAIRWLGEAVADAGGWKP